MSSNAGVIWLNCGWRIMILPMTPEVLPFAIFAVGLVFALMSARALALADTTDPTQPLPGDKMIAEYLARITDEVETDVCAGAGTQEEWLRLRPQLREQFLYMLGLWPLPEKTPLKATVTGSLTGDGFHVDNLHFQSRPGLYVTANLYRPATIEPGKRLPAVLYLCGHSRHGRDGNKVVFSPFGIWFARHGYVCLILDTLMLGEIAGVHHGTASEHRWWWISRGYTPAGVECWNAIRALDYLTSREDVDPDRLGVTGISGGGAASWYVAGADERIKVAVPVSGMADLGAYIKDRYILGHCDCMFMHNAFRWPWTRIAALTAPRPALFGNSDHDRLFPMDANERIIKRLKQVYKLFGAGDRVDAMVSMGNHEYRRDLREGTYRFMNLYLKGGQGPITDSERSLIGEENNDSTYPIPPFRLRVFPQDSELPADERNTGIDQSFVSVAKVAIPAAGEFESWRADLLRELRGVSLGYFPERIPAGKVIAEGFDTHLESEKGITVVVRGDKEGAAQATRIVLTVDTEALAEGRALDGYTLLRKYTPPDDVLPVCFPRGVGETRWTEKDPPNPIARSHVLLGRTVDSGRVWDAIAAARYIRGRYPDTPVYLLGRGPGAVLAAYAALFEPDIAGVIAIDPPSSHMDPAAPAILNVLRVCDIPEIFGMLAPRPLQIVGGNGDALARTAAIYAAAGAEERLSMRSVSAVDERR